MATVAVSSWLEWWGPADGLRRSTQAKLLSVVHLLEGELPRVVSVLVATDASNHTEGAVEFAELLQVALTLMEALQHQVGQSFRILQVPVLVTKEAALGYPAVQFVGLELPVVVEVPRTR
jgi:hypothetical protein